MGCALLSDLEAGHWCATLELKINFVRPVSVPGPPVVAVGRVRTRGRTSALIEASLRVEAREVAFATSTYVIRDSRRLPGEPADD